MAYRTPLNLTANGVFICEAKKYEYRTDWKRGNSRHYQYVHRKRRGILPLCTAHMKQSCNPFIDGYQVYAYEFPDHTVYVGLTCMPERRHAHHRLVGPVHAKLESGFEPHFLVLADGIMPSRAAELEIKRISEYLDLGWVLLNRSGGGEVGQIRMKYGFEAVLRLARECGATTRSEFQSKRHGAYQFAVKYKLLDRLAAELGWPEHAGHVWTRELCLANASCFDTLVGWIQTDRGSYMAAYNNGWLAWIKRQHRFTKPELDVKWTQMSCEKRARQFQSRSHWQYGCMDGSYGTARKKRWLRRIAAAVFGKRLSRWKDHGRKTCK